MEIKQDYIERITRDSWTGKLGNQERREEDGCDIKKYKDRSEGLDYG